MWDFYEISENSINISKSEIETWVPSVTKIDDTYFIFQAIQELISICLCMDPIKVVIYDS